LGLHRKKVKYQKSQPGAALSGVKTKAKKNEKKDIN
jgi:hypothetical protein